MGWIWPGGYDLENPAFGGLLFLFFCGKDWQLLQ